MIHEMAMSVLERPIYGMWQVDSLLGLRAGTARRWIDGYDRRGQHYEPVIREKTRGVEVVTWGEFVEARLLANYRKQKIPMVKLRPVVERLRTELETPYPLAASRLWLHAEGSELVRRVQEEVGLERGLHLVEVVRTGQYGVSTASDHADVEFTKPVLDFLEHVEFDGEEFAVRIYPMGKGSSVACDPVRAFGAPAVRTVRTDVIAEERRAGQPVDSIAAGYGLTVEEVEDAVRFEQRLRAA